jgi:hypothetical protein
LLATYHNQLGGSGMSVERATKVAFAWAMGGAIAGLLLGALLVALGVVSEKNIGAE